MAANQKQDGRKDNGGNLTPEDRSKGGRNSGGSKGKSDKTKDKAGR